MDAVFSEEQIICACHLLFWPSVCGLDTLFGRLLASRDGKMNINKPMLSEGVRSDPGSPGLVGGTNRRQLSHVSNPDRKEREQVG